MLGIAVNRSAPDNPIEAIADSAAVIRPPLTVAAGLAGFGTL